MNKSLESGVLSLDSAGTEPHGRGGPGPSRREFLKASAIAACSAGLGVGPGSGPGLGAGFGARAEVFGAPLALSAGNSAAGPAKLSLKKGLVLSMVSTRLSFADRFKMVRDAGFDVVQAPTTPDERSAEEMKKAADAVNIRIDSVMNMDHWQYPLSSSDPAVVEKSLAGMRTSLRNAKLWGSDVVLLVPAVVDQRTSYRDAWTRSQREIRKLIPLARDLKIVIGIEEVWNKFLLSPLEMNAYVSEFRSPWVKTWF